MKAPMSFSQGFSALGHVLRPVFLPPRYTTVFTRAVMASGRTVRMIAGLSAIFTNIGIAYAFGGDPQYNQTALRVFLSVNFPLMTLYLILAYSLHRPPTPRFAWVNSICEIVEITAVLVWVQLTGSTSSYFIMIAGMAVFMQRTVLGYWPGLIGLATCVGQHLSIFVLEELGVLPIASLFHSDASSILHQPELRFVALAGIISGYILAFTVGGAIANQVALARRALGAAESTIHRLAQGQKLGRLSGAVIGQKYELEELLGRGGMGEVYKARCVTDDQTCALKVLHPHLDDQRSLERFKREAELASRIPGKVAPRVLDAAFGDTEERFIAMELLEGESLWSHLVRKETLPVEEAMALLRQIAAAIDAAHAQSVVHRDLKPQNVFLEGHIGRHHRVRLLDFGISKLAGSGHSLTMTQGVLGTPGYMAPEQVLGRPEEVGPAADIYALGVIAYECLTGKAAFPNLSLQDILRHLQAPTPVHASTVRPELPRSVDHVLIGALAQSPAIRPSSGAQLMTQLATALAPNRIIDIPTEEDAPPDR